jgi:hypothetical protein
MVTSTWRCVSLGILQETPGFVTCHDFSEKVWIFICHVHEFITEPHVVVTLFLYQHSWYNVLANSAPSDPYWVHCSNYQTKLQLSMQLSLTTTRAHPPHLIPILWYTPSTVVKPLMRLKHLAPGYHLSTIHVHHSKHLHYFSVQFSRSLAKCELGLLLMAVHFPALVCYPLLSSCSWTILLVYEAYM